MSSLDTIEKFEFLIKFKIKNDTLEIPDRESSLHIESKIFGIFGNFSAEEANRRQNCFFSFLQ